MSQLRPSKELLQRYLDSTCTEEERIVVDNWYNSLNLSDDTQFSSSDEIRLYKRIRSKTGSKSGQIRSLWFKVAAAVVLLATLGIWSASLLRTVPKSIEISSQTPEPLPITYQNEKSQVVPYTLPDGSVIQLLPGAKVIHPVRFPATKRPIQFTGEGFFSIVKNSNAPFTIESGRLKTEVLGTTFSLKAHPDDNVFNIVVSTGKVALTLDNDKNERIILNPNQKAVLEHRHERLIVASMPEKASEKELWQPISLVFEDTPLRTIISQLEIIFNTSINFENPQLGDCTLTIELKNQNLPDALSMLTILLNISYELKNDEILITGDKCGA